VRADEDAEPVLVPTSSFPEMIRECPTVTTVCVHEMLDRARQFASSDWQDEKMMSLGRLAAGLAHELNNPASAASRSARLLAAALAEADEASAALGAAQLSAEQRAQVDAVRTRSLIPATTGVFSVLERTDREDELTAWLERHHADTAHAQVLAESGVTE